MGTKLLVCVAGAGPVQCPFDPHDRSDNFVGWPRDDSNRKASELALVGNRIDCCWLQSDRIRRLSNRNRGCNFSLCAFTIVAMGNGAVRRGRAVLFSPSYRVSGFLRCLRRTRSLRHSITCREYALAATFSDPHGAPVDVAGGADAGATREGNRRAREGGPVPCAGDGQRRDGMAGERVGGGFLCQPELATAYRTERKRDARVWVAAGGSSRRPRAHQAVVGARND